MAPPAPRARDVGAPSSHVTTRLIAAQAACAYAASGAFENFSVAAGGWEEGVSRAIAWSDALAYATTHAGAAAIRRRGVELAHRPRALPGFAFWPEHAPPSVRHEFPAEVRGYVVGPIWDPGNEATNALDVVRGTTPDPQWNDLVRRIDAAEGVDHHRPRGAAYWAARGRASVRQREALLQAGWAGVVLGGELHVVDLDALYIAGDAR